MEEIKNKEYAGEYSSVGRVMMLNLIAGAGALLLLANLIFLLGFGYTKQLRIEFK